MPWLFYDVRYCHGLSHGVKNGLNWSTGYNFQSIFGKDDIFIHEQDHAVGFGGILANTSFSVFIAIFGTLNWFLWASNYVFYIKITILNLGQSYTYIVFMSRNKEACVKALYFCSMVYDINLLLSRIVYQRLYRVH